jgi:hypothetical protein
LSHVFIESSLHSENVGIGVWAAISTRRIIGPIFFEGNFQDFKINFFKLIVDFGQNECSKVSTGNFATIF